MKHTLIGAAVIAFVVTAAPRAVAQGRGEQLRPNRAAMLQDINQRFANQVIKEMGLSADQVPRFRRIVVSWAQKRSALEAEEQRLRMALANEFRPGVAANPDSAAKFVDAVNDNRVEYAMTFRDEMRELTPILSPVQRGQFQVARDRLLQRIKEQLQQRAAGRVGGAPAGGPGKILQP
jgi:hypothetical protein